MGRFTSTANNLWGGPDRRPSPCQTRPGPLRALPPLVIETWPKHGEVLQAHQKCFSPRSFTAFFQAALLRHVRWPASSRGTHREGLWNGKRQKAVELLRAPCWNFRKTPSATLAGPRLQPVGMRNGVTRCHVLLVASIVGGTPPVRAFVTSDDANVPCRTAASDYHG